MGQQLRDALILPSNISPPSEHPISPTSLLSLRRLLMGLSSLLYLSLFCSHRYAIFPFRSSPQLASFSTTVTWARCPDDLPSSSTGSRFACAFVDVPLDYSKGYDGGTATLALSKYSTGKEAKKGTVFINPGGPGGSGYDFNLAAGPFLSNIFRDTYDIIGFDPRGVGRTTPALRCFKTARDETLFLASHPEAPEVFGSREAYRRGAGRADAINRLLAEQCEREAGGKGGAGRHMGTATVVRDIELLSTLIDGKDAPINFYGWSYGTIIASYLIGMFPDRIGHVVADGVVDPLNWIGTPHHQWGRSDYQDSEITYETFLSECVKAGSTRCPLAIALSTTESLAKELDDFLDRLLISPLVVREQNGSGGMLTPIDVKDWMLQQLYRPTTWSRFASGLREALNGEGSMIWADVKMDIELHATVPGSTRILGVECSDSLPYAANVSSEEIVDLIVDENLWAVENVSRHFAGTEFTSCPYWTHMRDAERFTGPFNQTLSNSIIIIGNTFDPVTSLTNARLLNTLQPQSCLIQHDAHGHCSTAQVSLCTIKAIQEYFLADVLPPNGLRCKPAFELFPPPKEDEGGRTEAFSVEDRELLDASEGLGRVLLMRGGRWKGR